MRRSKEEWLAKYVDWQASGKTQVRYCDLKRIRYTAFRDKIYNLRKTGMIKKSGNQAKSEAKAPKFQSVSVIEAKEIEEVAYCEIKFGAGHKITISSQESLRKLKGMIQCLIQA